jgi:glycosyltransferase involved in cell wall biosynthesis
MKVIIVNDHLYPDGGADVVALASAEGLAAEGVDVTLFVGDRLRSDDRTLRRTKLVCTGQRDLLSGQQHPGVALQGLWNLPAARALRELLREHDPRDTVVHLHSWTKSLSSSVVQAVTAAGFPLVCTLHEYFSYCPNGMLFDHQTASICTRKPMSMSCVTTHCDARSYAHKLYRVVRHGVQQTIGGMPGALREFIVVSRFSEAILRPALPAGARIHHVRNPIEVPAGPPADVAAARGFVMVARLFRPKGQALFLEACERAGVPAVCVGEGLDLAELQARFPSARFTGQLGREGVAEAMRQARALVLPSLWYETQGLVVAEAAALGVPAIVSDACAAVDFVEHEQTGLLFRSGNVGDLAAALRRLHDEPALAARMGEEARRRFWADPPTPAAHGRELMAVYRQVLERACQAGALAAHEA